MTKRNTQKATKTKAFQWPPYLTHGLAVALYLILTAAYFYPQIEGKIIMQSDILGWQGMAKESMDYYEETGEIALWSNSMFGGMPTYQTNNLQPGNYLQYVLKAAGLFITRPIGVFLAGAVFCYMMLLIMGVRPLGAWLGGFAFAFTTYHPILFEAGHTSKLLSITTFPVIISGMYLVFQKKYLPGAVLFASGMGMALFANHVQMTYFLGIALGFYVIAEVIKNIQLKEFGHLGKSLGLLAIGLLLGVGSSAGKLWTTYDYGKDTMRGDPILETTGTPKSSSETSGLEWEYAMQWSQSSLELFTLLVPGVAGGSSAEKVSPNSELRKSLTSRGVNLPSDFAAPLYWGKMPFTSGPVYVGVLICFFFLMGMVLEKGPLKWWILAGVVFTLLYSMGKNFAAFNQLVYDYLPLMNKFRSPNSITAVTPVLMIILGASTIKHIFDGTFKTGQIKKGLIWSAGPLALICLFFALVGPGVYEFTSPGDAQLEQAGYPMDAIIADRAGLMKRDAFRSLFILVLGAAAVWFFIRGKLSAMWALLGLACITVIDLWGVNKRYLDNGDFVASRNYDEYFKPRPVDEQILQDEDLYYRVHDLSINTFNSSLASYHHKTIGGYHAAKLQRYQDMIDRYISKNNMEVLNMLNTRYFIIKPDPQGEAVVQRNPDALGNAWFVENVKFVSSANEEIDAIGEDFDPATTAIVHKEFEPILGTSTFDDSGTITLTDYSPNELKYSINASSDQFAVFSEIWYGPNKGWVARIDGKEVDIVRVNYVLRGLEIPAGSKEVTFSFEPRTHFLGETIARASSGILLLALIGMVILQIMDYRKKKMVQT